MMENTNGLEIMNELTETVIGGAFKVSNTLGVGFLEKVYENALAHEIRKKGLRVEQQYPVQVFYDDVLVGDYVADLLVEQSLIVELKAVASLELVHHAQCINYLRATGYKLALLINFGKSRIEIKRVAL